VVAAGSFWFDADPLLVRLAAIALGGERSDEKCEKSGCFENRFSVRGPWNAMGNPIVMGALAMAAAHMLDKQKQNWRGQQQMAGRY
jgi:hypothetical protein